MNKQEIIAQALKALEMLPANFEGSFPLTIEMRLIEGVGHYTGVPNLDYLTVAANSKHGGIFQNVASRKPEWAESGKPFPAFFFFDDFASFPEIPADATAPLIVEDKR